MLDEILDELVSSSRSRRNPRGVKRKMSNFPLRRRTDRPLPPIDIKKAIKVLKQGNRVKKLCGDEACKEVVIPGGDFAAESEGILSPGSPD